MQVQTQETFFEINQNTDFDAVFALADKARNGLLKRLASVTGIHERRISAIINRSTSVSLTQKILVAQALIADLKTQQESLNHIFSQP